MKYLVVATIFALGFACGSTLTAWMHPDAAQIQEMKIVSKALETMLEEDARLLRDIEHKYTELKRELIDCRTPPLYAAFSN